MIGMPRIWNLFKYSFSLLLIAGLLFSGSVFSVLLYAKATGKDLYWSPRPAAEALAEKAEPKQEELSPPPQAEKPKSAKIDAPVVKQLPELPSGCEVTSLTMLLQYYGIKKDKMDLVPEMKKDPTPLVWGENGIKSWGNPNTGFVGEITGKGKGFGIYHAGLFDLLHKYVTEAVDLTGQPFETLERQLADGIPSVVWTTIDYRVPDEWVVWETPLGPIRTTFMEHAVLLVGYDESYVYVNDPLSGKKNVPVDKDQFIATWEAMGKQALSYQKSSK